jgi:uncharacterized protein
MALALPRWLAGAALGLGLLGSILLPLAQAQELQPVPALTARVIDQTATLRPEQQQALEAKLAAFEQAQGSQIVVLMVATTQPEDIAAYAYRVADAWKIGRREVGDGLLLVVAKNDRRVRIEVARALEGAIPDLAAYRIIDEFITPAFRQGDFADGIDAGLDRLMGLIRGEGLPAPAQGSRRGDAAPGLGEWLAFVLVGTPIVGGILSSMMGRRLGSVATGGVIGAVGWLVTASILLGALIGVVALVVALAMGSGGGIGGGRGGRSGGPVIWGGGRGGGGWGGGGGFGSGGGGSFGGGGASGRW